MIFELDSIMLIPLPHFRTLSICIEMFPYLSKKRNKKPSICISNWGGLVYLGGKVRWLAPRDDVALTITHGGDHRRRHVCGNSKSAGSSESWARAQDVSHHRTKCFHCRNCAVNEEVGTRSSYNTPNTQPPIHPRSRRTKCIPIKPLCQNYLLINMYNWEAHFQKVFILYLFIYIYKFWPSFTEWAIYMWPICFWNKNLKKNQEQHSRKWLKMPKNEPIMSSEQKRTPEPNHIRKVAIWTKINV